MERFGSTAPACDIRELFPGCHVGFDSIPIQLEKKRVQEGFYFNILLIGETGIGKSTLISSLFNISPDLPIEALPNPELNLKFKVCKLSEKGVNLLLTIIETVGYGDRINRNDDIPPIISYVESQLENYLEEELKIKRDMHYDSRVHACIYFIFPTGRSLKSIDLFCMKKLHDMVNVIPIIAKSDSLTKPELQRFKMAIQEELEREKVKFYQFPEDDEVAVDKNSKINKAMPFAVCASSDYMCVGDKMQRGRQFPWGTMLVEDEGHSDFKILKDMLIGTNMEDLREKTHLHYEHYRRHRLTELGFGDFYFEDLKTKRKQLDDCMSKEEETFKKMFVEKVGMRERELKQQERMMRRVYDKEYMKMKVEMENTLDEKEELDSQILEFQKKTKSQQQLLNSCN